MPSAFDKNKLGAPPSDKKVSLSLEHVSGEVSKAETEADDRLKDLGVPVGNGQLNKVDVDMTSLEEDMAAEREMKRLGIKAKEAAMAMQLWSQTYDGKRELVPVDKTGAPAGASATTAPAAAAPATPAVDPDVAKAQQQMDLENRRQAMDDELTRKKQEALLRLAPYPVVSSISGIGDTVEATVLVPYFGAVKPKAGEYLPDTRHLLVRKITPQGVIVEATDGRIFMLSGGSSVPSDMPNVNAGTSDQRKHSPLH